MINIRLLQLGEEEEFIKLKKESLELIPYYLIDAPSSDTPDQVRWLINHPIGPVITIVLEYAGELLGFCQANIDVANPKRKHMALIKSMYVRRDDRVAGQRIGHKITHDLIEYLKTIGVTYALSGTMIGNHSSEKILADLGFEVIFIDEHFLLKDDGTYVASKYWKKLF